VDISTGLYCVIADHMLWPFVCQLHGYQLAQKFPDFEVLIIRIRICLWIWPSLSGVIVCYNLRLISTHHNEL